MKEHYFDYESLKRDFIDMIENLNLEEYDNAEKLIEMFAIISPEKAAKIQLLITDIHENVNMYERLEEDLKREMEEEVPSAATITQLKQEMHDIRNTLFHIAKLKVQEDSGFDNSSSATPEELVRKWLNTNSTNAQNTLNWEEFQI